MPQPQPAVDVSEPAAGVTLVTLNRPARLNTLNRTLVNDLTGALTRIGEDRRCRVAIITGAGRAFCAGLDLKGGYDGDRPQGRGEPIIDLLSQQEDVAGLVEAVHGLPQVVVAAVNGPAAGGGLALVCASDVRIAAEPAVFAVSFIRAGFSGCDMGVSWLLPRIVGAGRAHELMLTGRRVDASEAYRIGLVTDVVPPSDLLAAALAKAREIMANPPFSVRLTKRGMWAGIEASSLAAAIQFENRQQVLTAMTQDATEATAAFLEKRAPRYTGE